jgi:hypothetical protein
MYSQTIVNNADLDAVPTVQTSTVVTALLFVQSINQSERFYSAPKD